MCSKPYKQGVAEYGCGQCMPCRINRRRMWTTRIMMEMQNYAPDSCLFVTLTYDDEHLPSNGSLQPRDLQLYFKKLRKLIAPSRLRYYAVGEYGEHTKRPHYHIILFGVCSLDAVRACWEAGHVHVGTVTEQSAGYVTGYVTNKLSNKSLLPAGCIPEFARMSLKPGIGALAMDVLAKAVHTKGGSKLVASQGDVPTVVRSNKSLWPLGRYLRRKLREKAGIPQSAATTISESRAAELADKLRGEGERVKHEEKRWAAKNRARLLESISKSKGRL